jgi:GNAT superfamily N-acetyltransferase
MKETQICIGCGAEKSLKNGFFKNSIKKNGYDSKCKECRKKQSEKWRTENRIRFNESARRSYDPGKKHEYYKKNKERILKDKSKYWKNNQDKIRARVKQWRAQNYEDVIGKERNNRISIINDVLDFLGSKCVLCGEETREFLTVDHINNNGNQHRHFGSVGWKRKILIGEFNRSDFRVLCHNCNLAEYRKDPIHQFKEINPVGIKKVCNCCQDGKDISEFCSQKSHSKNFCLQCNREKQARIRSKCYEFLGGKCICCGESDFLKLTVDHIHNDGKQRRDIEKTGVNICRKILNKQITDIQLLCWNCNFSKHLGNGVCWHQRKGPSIKPGFKIISVIKMSWMDNVIEFLDQYHYAKSGRPPRVVYSAIKDDQIIAIAKFASPIRQGIAASVGVKHGQVLELDRFCIHPDYQEKNLASHLMSRVIRKLKLDFPNVLKLVSFADPAAGHVGTIYRASNWKEVGKTSPSYYYEDLEGNQINKKTLYNKARLRGFKEREYAEQLGLKKIRLPRKLKFVYEL